MKKERLTYSHKYLVILLFIKNSLECQTKGTLKLQTGRVNVLSISTISLVGKLCQRPPSLNRISLAVLFETTHSAKKQTEGRACWPGIGHTVTATRSASETSHRQNLHLHHSGQVQCIYFLFGTDCMALLARTK